MFCNSWKIVNFTVYETSVFVFMQGSFKLLFGIRYEEDNKQKGYNKLEAVLQQALSVYPVLL